MILVSVSADLYYLWESGELDLGGWSMVKRTIKMDVFIWN